MFRKLSIKAKLAGLVLMFLAVLGTVAGISISGMTAMDRNADTLVNDAMRPALAIGTVQDMMRADVETLFRIGQLDPRLNDGEEPAAWLIEDYAAEIESNMAFSEQLWQQYTTSVEAGSERAGLVPAFESAHAEYVSVGINPMLALYEGGNFEEAAEHLRRTTLPLYEDMADLVYQLQGIDTALADQLAEQGNEVYANVLRTSLIMVLAALIASVLIGYLVARSIIRPANRAVEVFDAIGRGELDSQIRITSEDEMGRILQGLENMQRSLRERLEAERAEAEKNRRVSEALDAVDSAIMIADARMNVVHLNPAAGTLFTDNGERFKRDLPKFDPEKLVGSSIDVFHRDPERHREILENLTETHNARIEIADMTFSLAATPIFDDNGSRLGTVVQWADVTDQVGAEREIETLVRAASRGDFSERIALEGKKGFFLNLGRHVNSLVETTDTSLTEVVRVMGALADGDLTQRVTGDFQGAFGELRDSTNRTIGQLEQLIGQVRAAVDSITSASSEIAAGNTNLSQRTEEQAASLEETASSMEEMTSTVRQNADNARQANQLSQGAREVANRGGDKVREVVSSMSEISDSAQKISNIITVIDGIAFQTNILALNAAVEAARAGEQGRGFAVVAGEVRTLAQRSADAAKEIKELINASVRSVENGNGLVSEAGETMEEIVNSIKRVTDIMSEISAASDEQSQGIDQVNTTISQLDEMTQQNAALVEQATAAAGSMEQQARSLADSVNVFQLRAMEEAGELIEGTRGAAETAAEPPVENAPAAARPRAAKGHTKSPAREGANGSAGRPKPANAPEVTTVGDEEWAEF